MPADSIQNFSLAEDVPNSVHADLLSLVKAYLVVGGMPEAVAAFAETKSYHDVEIVKESFSDPFLFFLFRRLLTKECFRLTLK